MATAQTVALGDVELTVGPVGADGLYGSGAVVESFPGALFADGQARAVASVIEDADGVWTLSYTGGRTDDWRPAAELDDVVITAEYADGVDSREFVLGGFVESAQGRALQLTPPIPGGGRDWEARSGELVTLSFSRRVAAAAPTTPPPPPWSRRSPSRIHSSSGWPRPRRAAPSWCRRSSPSLCSSASC